MLFLLAEVRFALATVAGHFALFIAMRSRTGRLVAARADHLELVHANRVLALGDATLHVLARVRLLVLPLLVDALDDGRALGRLDAENFALLSAVLARQNDDVVAPADMRLSDR